MGERKNRLGKTGIFVMALIMVLGAVSGCDYLEKRRIQNIVKKRTQALMSGDVSGYLDFFT